jgi:hypothetical protein
MNTFGRFLYGSLLVSLSLLQSEVRAQAPAGQMPGKIYTREQHFVLPLLLDEKDRANLQDVQLYVKTGPNDFWICKDTVPAMQTGFDYRVPQDGEYWFTIASIDKTGKITPADTKTMSPGLIVVVDSTPPELTLQTLPPSTKGVLIACKVKDANPDPSKLKIEYQLADNSWQVLEALPDDPSVFRLPGPALPESVIRATATDRAGNTTTRQVSLASMFAATTPLQPVPVPRPVESRSDKTLTPSAVVSGTSPAMTTSSRTPDFSMATSSRQASDIGLPPAPRPSPDLVSVTTGRPVPEIVPTMAPTTTTDLAASAPVRQLVNATRVTLEYQIETQGPTGVSKVEVFITKDNGMTWSSVQTAMHGRSPLEFDLPGEGTYGVSLIVTNGTGLCMPPPKRGDAPDYWVEVDLTRPAAQLMAVTPGFDKEAGTMHITWAATDRNLGATPIDLYYATQHGGPWQPIARGVKNDGSYRWTLPKNAGPEFYVRMDVTDQAGNLTRCEAPKPVLVDLVKPKAKVLTITAKANRLTAPMGN